MQTDQVQFAVLMSSDAAESARAELPESSADLNVQIRISQPTPGSLDQLEFGPGELDAYIWMVLTFVGKGALSTAIGYVLRSIVDRLSGKQSVANKPSVMILRFPNAEIVKIPIDRPLAASEIERLLNKHK